MVVTGGYGNSSTDIANIAERYDALSDSWQSLQPLPFPLYAHTQVAIPIQYSYGHVETSNSYLLCL